MAITIKNQTSGRKIIVKNQDDMFNLVNTGTTKAKVKDNTDLDSLDRADAENYANDFSFNPDSGSEKPVNYKDDPYYDFSKTGEPQPEEEEFTPTDSDMDVEHSFDYDDSLDEPESEEAESEDSDYQGEIRSVTGANLVYKRQTQDGTYDELWIYTIGKDMKSEFAIRKAILSGTDIDPNTQESDDGSQKAITKSLGNVQFISISGLPQ